MILRFGMLMNVLSKSFRWLFFSIITTGFLALLYIIRNISSRSLFFTVVDLESSIVSFFTLRTIGLGDYHQLSIHILWRLLNLCISVFIYLFIFTNPSLSARAPCSGQPVNDDCSCTRLRERGSISFSIKIDGILRGSEYPLITPRSGMEKMVVDGGGRVCSSASLCALPAIERTLITSVLCFSLFPRSPAQMKNSLFPLRF